jgi:hypothetical protein
MSLGFIHFLWLNTRDANWRRTLSITRILSIVTVRRSKGGLSAGACPTMEGVKSSAVRWRGARGERYESDMFTGS